MKNIEEKITSFEKMISQLRAKKQLIDNRIKTAKAKTKRDNDTRKKILIGVAILSKVELNTLPFDLTSMMDTFLTRPDDRAIFDLQPLPIITKPDDQQSTPQT